MTTMLSAVHARRQVQSPRLSYQSKFKVDSNPPQMIYFCRALAWHRIVWSQKFQYLIPITLPPQLIICWAKFGVVNSPRPLFKLAVPWFVDG